MKRILFILVIALVAAAAGGLYWYHTGERGFVTSSRWLSHTPERIVSIHVQRGDAAYTLVQSDEGWEAQIPGGSWNIKARVLPGRVDGFLDRLRQLAPIRSHSIDSGHDLRKYGLHEPRLRIILQSQGGNPGPLTVRVNKDESGRVYAWNSESPKRVYEFDGEVLGDMAIPALHFLDNRVFKFDEDKVDRVQMVQLFGSSWLVRSAKQGYVFDLPGYLKGKMASDSAIKLYVHALALLRAGKLLMEPVTTEKQMADLTIKVWTKDGKNPSFVEFYSIKDDKKNYLGRSSWLTVPFLVDVESVGQLVRSAFDVQGRNIFNLDLGQVTSLMIEHGSARYVVGKTSTGWQVAGEEKPLAGIDMALWRITELQFEALPLNNLPDTAVKRMVFRLRDKDGKLLASGEFYTDPKLPQGQCWMRNGEGMYYPVSSRLLKDLQGMFPANVAGE